jgi:hypothetical protein
MTIGVVSPLRKSFASATDASRLSMPGGQDRGVRDALSQAQERRAEEEQEEERRDQDHDRPGHDPVGHLLPARLARGVGGGADRAAEQPPDAVSERGRCRAS